MLFSPKDKKILTFLGVFIASVLLLKFYLYPQIKLILKMQADLKAGRVEYSSNIKMGAQIKEIDSNLKIVNQRLKDIRTKFPPVMNYDEVFIIVRNMAKSSEIDINSLNFNVMSQLNTSGESSVTTEGSNKTGTANNDLKQGSNDSDSYKIENLIKEMGLADTESNDVNTGYIPNGKGYELNVKIAATGTIIQIKNFLRLVENLKCKVIYNGLQINTGEKGILSFSAGISFIGIADNSAGKYAILESGEWAPLNAAVKSDIFNPYDGYVGAHTKTTMNITEQNSATKDALSEVYKYDFTMRAVPFSENLSLPTVSLTAKKVVPEGNGKTMPIVYGDNVNEEKVDLYVEEKNGKFYCKFKTDHEYYPEATYTSMAEFTPIGNEIKLLVDSTVRKFSTDNSSVKINITNKTKRNFAVNVIGDDKLKPRIKFAGLASNVKVTYE